MDAEPSLTRVSRAAALIRAYAWTVKAEDAAGEKDMLSAQEVDLALICAANVGYPIAQPNP